MAALLAQLSQWNGRPLPAPSGLASVHSSTCVCVCSLLTRTSSRPESALTMWAPCFPAPEFYCSLNSRNPSYPLLPAAPPSAASLTVLYCRSLSPNATSHSAI